MHIYIYQVIKIIFILYTGSLIKKTNQNGAKNDRFHGRSAIHANVCSEHSRKEEEKKTKRTKKKEGTRERIKIQKDAPFDHNGSRSWKYQSPQFFRLTHIVFTRYPIPANRG